MSAVEDRDNDASGPHTDRNPGAPPAETAAPVRPRAQSSSERPPGSDTLLSVPTPASREDLAFDERLSACERKLEELTERVAALEGQRASRGAGPARGYWAWLAFLAALALAWQILSFLR